LVFERPATTQDLCSFPTRRSSDLRACGVTEAQKQKLKLAARGDMARFFDDVAELREKYEGQADNNMINEASQACQPLQKRFLTRSEEHTSELQSRENLVCRLLLEK